MRNISCICETFLKSNLNLYTHPDFIIYRFDREERAKGGVMIAIRKRIKHQLIPALDTKLLECIGVQIEFADNSKLQIFSVYLPGGSKNHEINNHFINDVRKITRRNISYFAMGDYNTKHRFWNCNRANHAGSLLYNEYQNSNFLIMHPSTPTHFPNDSSKLPSTIDFALTNGIHPNTEPITTSMNSDHCAVEFQILTNRALKIQNEKLIPCFRKANWEKFRISVSRNLCGNDPDINAIHSTEQIDDMVEKYTDILLEAQHKSVPLITPNKYAINLTPDIEEAIKLRNHYKRQWQRTRNPAIKSLVNKLSKIISARIIDIKNMNWNHELSMIPKSDNKLWQTSKHLKNKNKIMPPLKVAEKTLLTPEEKANALADHFALQHENPLSNDSPNFTTYVEEKVQTFFNSAHDDKIIDFPSPEETAEIIKNIKKSKAPGIDRVHNSLLKQLPWKGVVYLNFIIMCCLKLSYFPEKWKKAQVIAIHKPGKNPTSASSYRPISLLSSISKILEKIILKRIIAHVNENNIIPEEQHGFKSGKLTIHQLSRIVQHIKENFKINQQSTGMVLLDVEKAFDRVWHSGLLYKLIKFKFPPYIIKIAKSMITGRKFQVCVKGKLSKIKQMPFGLAQGGVTSPIFYNIYTADIPKHLNCLLALFADDTSILCTSQFVAPIIKNLQEYLEILKNFYRKWKIKINADKTKAIYFTKRRTRELPENPLNVLGTEIEWSPVVKYLGIMLDKKLVLNQHINYAVAKVNLVVKILYPLISRKSRLDTSNKLLLYKQIFRPILSYGCPVFVNAAKVHIKKMQIAQNKIIKLIFQLPWRTSTKLIHEIANITPIHEYFVKIAEKFHRK